MKRYYYIYLLPIFLVLLTACSFSLAEDITPPPGAEQAMPISQTQPAVTNGPLYPLVPPNPEKGRPAYAEKCAPCHGESGQGDGPRASQLPNPVAPLGSPELARQVTPADWYSMVTEGNLERFMPPFSSLSDRQRWEVVAYSYMLSTTEAELEQGAELYQQNCAGCHGQDGQGDGPQMANLSAQPVDFTDQALMAQKSATDLYEAITNGVSAEMPAFSDQLGEDERWALATYLRTLTFVSEEQPTLVSETDELAESTASQALETESLATEVPAIPLAEAPHSMGQVVGVVTNASGGNAPAGLEVKLRGFDDMQEVITQTTTLQADGTFAFENIEMLPGRVFVATVDYNETTYGSDIGVVEPDMQTLDLPVAIYDTTTDATILSVDRLHLFFEFIDENTLRVIQLYIMSNPSNQTVVAAGEGEPTIRFKLPAGAQNLEFQDGVLGGRFVRTEDGFGDTVAIRPGASTYELLYAYDMPYDRKLELSQPMPYLVNAVVVLLPEGNVKIKSDLLTDGGLRDVQGAQYRMYNGSAIPAGTDLVMTISGRPSSATPGLTRGSSTNAVIGLGVFGFALIVTGVWLYRRSRLAGGREEVEVDEQAPEAPKGPETESAENLVDTIIVLDDLYQEGKLPEEAYLQRRAELKARLQNLMDAAEAGD